MSSLVLCSSCGRHLRSTETACPFCDAPAPGVAPGTAAPPSRARRAVAFAATLTAAACAPTVADKVAPEPTPTATTMPPKTAAALEPTATATPTTTATAPTASASASGTPVASAKATASGTAARPVHQPSPVVHISPPSVRYGLPPFLTDDEFV